MKYLITTIAALVLVGCGTTQPPEPPTAKAPDISIHEAARDGNIEAVKQHLADGADVNARVNDGWTPMHFAIDYGRKEVAELLISKGADVNAKDDGDGSLLHFATDSGYREVAELLITKGADVNAKRVDGETPLDMAEEVFDHHTVEENAAKKETADILRKHGGKTGEE